MKCKQNKFLTCIKCGNCELIECVDLAHRPLYGVWRKITDEKPP